MCCNDACSHHHLDFREVRLNWHPGCALPPLHHHLSRRTRLDWSPQPWPPHHPLWAIPASPAGTTRLSLAASLRRVTGPSRVRQPLRGCLLLLLSPPSDAFCLRLFVRWLLAAGPSPPPPPSALEPAVSPTCVAPASEVSAAVTAAMSRVLPSGRRLALNPHGRGDAEPSMSEAHLYCHRLSPAPAPPRLPSPQLKPPHPPAASAS